MDASLVIAVATSALLSAGLTPMFAAVARRSGLVVAPRADRWHKRPTPLLGGAAIAAASFITAALVLDAHTVVVVVGCGVSAFALGLFDDFKRLRPTTKLVGQAIVGALLYIGGVHTELVGIAPIEFILTIFWVVAIMNAVNLMDNMDGLAAGVGAIAALALALTASRGDPAPALLAMTIAGAAVGFLVHNFYPAKVFMGDAGSHVLGFLLACAALMHTAAGATNVAIAVLTPVLVLAVPIFDTALVTASRRLAGQPIGQGGKDHTSHRLAALGVSDRNAVLILYAVAAATAAIALIADRAELLFLPLFVLAVIALTLFGLFLVEVDVYGRGDRSASTHSRIGGALFIYGRFGIEVGLDVALLSTAYYISYLLRYEGSPDSVWVPYLSASLPIVVGCQLAALLLSGVYQTMWRFVGLSDAVRILRATALGTAGSTLVILLAFRFADYSRAVLVLDWLVGTALILGSRAFLLWLGRTFAARPGPGDRRALVVGATEGGMAVARLLTRGADDKRIRVVGFVDDDQSMRHRQIAGLSILGRTSDLEEVARHADVDLVVLAPDASAATRATASELCDSLGIEWREFTLSTATSRATATR